MAFFCLFADESILVITLNGSSHLYTDYQKIKLLQGYKVYLKELNEIQRNYSGISLPKRIKNCIREYHTLYNTKNVILAGDDQAIPVMEVYGTATKEDVKSDIFYFYLGETDSNHNGKHFDLGDDFSGEIAINGSRFPVANNTELNNVLEKTVSYLQNEENSEFLNRSFNLGFDLNTPGDSEEYIISTAQNLSNYSVKQRVQADAEYFTLDSIYHDLNLGYNVFYTMCHGSEVCLGNDDLRIYQDQILNTENFSGLYFVSSCHTGEIKYNSLAKSALISKKGGAVNYIGPSGQEYVSSAFQFQKTILQNINEGFNLGTALREAREGYKVYLQSNNLRRFTYFSYNLLGDPTALIYQNNENIEIDSLSYSNNILSVKFNKIPQNSLKLTIIDPNTGNILTELSTDLRETEVPVSVISNNLKIGFYSKSQPLKADSFKIENNSDLVILNCYPKYQNDLNYAENNSLFALNFVTFSESNYSYELTTYFTPDSISVVSFIPGLSDTLIIQQNIPEYFLTGEANELNNLYLYYEISCFENGFHSKDSLLVNYKKAAPVLTKAINSGNGNKVISLINYSEFTFPENGKMEFFNFQDSLIISLNYQQKWSPNDEMQFNFYYSESDSLIAKFYPFANGSKPFTIYKIKTVSLPEVLPTISKVAKSYTPSSVRIGWEVSNIETEQDFVYDLFIKTGDELKKVNKEPIVLDFYEIDFADFPSIGNKNQAMLLKGYLKGRSEDKNYGTFEKEFFIGVIDCSFEYPPADFTEHSFNPLLVEDRLTYLQKSTSLVIQDLRSGIFSGVKNTSINYGQSFQQSYGACDLNNDGKTEVITINPLREYSDSFAVELYSLDSKQLIARKTLYGYNIKNLPTTADLDGDGLKEILITAINGNLSDDKVKGGYIYGLSLTADSVFTICDNFPVVQNGNSLNCQAADFVKIDQSQKFIVGDNGSYLYAYDYENKINIRENIGSTIMAPLTFADLNDDGKIEVIAKVLQDNDGEYIRVFTFDGNSFTVFSDFNNGFPLKYSVPQWDFFDMIAPVKVIDLNDDGNIEFVFTGRDSLYIANQAGEFLKRIPLEFSEKSNDRNNSGLSFSDLNGDNVLDIIGFNEAGFLYAFSGTTGEILAGFPVLIPDLTRERCFPPLIRNLIIEGKKRISLVNNCGTIYNFDYGYTGSNWQKSAFYRENNSNSGFIDSGLENQSFYWDIVSPEYDYLRINPDSPEIIFRAKALSDNNYDIWQNWLISGVNQDIITDSLVFTPGNYQNNDSLTITALASDGISTISKKWFIKMTTAILEELSPQSFSLSKLYPNPFNGSVTINFTVGENDLVKLDVFNLKGQKVLTENLQVKPFSKHSVNLNLNKYSSGLYYFRISDCKKSFLKKAIYLK